MTQEEIDKLNLEERTYYRENLKNYRDTKNVIDTARKEGMERGANIRMVKNGLKANISFEIISKVTNLSIEEIQKIADSFEE